MSEDGWKKAPFAMYWRTGELPGRPHPPEALLAHYSRVLRDEPRQPAGRTHMGVHSAPMESLHAATLPTLTGPLG